MKVTIERHRCIGAGQCVLYAPELFEQDEEGLVVQLRDDLSESDREAIEGAVMSCPTGTLTLTEE